jgi:hypothetical protein
LHSEFLSRCPIRQKCQLFSPLIFRSKKDALELSNPFLAVVVSCALLILFLDFARVKEKFVEMQFYDLEHISASFFS